MPSDLFNRLQRVLPLVDKVADDIACEGTGILEEIVSRMFEVMQTTVKFSCDYVKRGRFGRQATFLDLADADDRREDQRRANSFGRQGNARENGRRVDRRH